MKRFRNIFIIILILAAAGYAVYRWQANQAVALVSAYQLVAAERGDLTAQIGATGVVRSNQSAVLTWQTSGIIDEVLVKTGQEVEAGQELATLKQTSLPQNVILAKADLASSQQALEDLALNAELAKVKAMQDIVTFEQAVRDAQYILDNYIIPTEQQGLSAVEAVDKFKIELDEARLAFEPYKFFASSDATRQRLKEDLDSAQSRYNAAVKRLKYEFNLQVAQANLAKAQQDYYKWESGPDPRDITAVEARIEAAQATLDLTHLTAPFAGSITGISIKAGDKVNPASVAFQIDDLTHLLVDVRVSEVDINRIKINQEATISFDAILSKVYQGLVVEVDQVGTSNQGVVDFIVTIELSNADEDVKPGMTSAVNIVVNQLQDVLLAPNRAVRVKDGERVVYILQNNLPTPIIVKLGASSDAMSEVLESDLKVGDQIILNPPLVFEGGGPPPFAR
jgi:HlyD family secretion protein